MTSGGASRDNVGAQWQQPVEWVFSFNMNKKHIKVGGVSFYKVYRRL